MKMMFTSGILTSLPGRYAKALFDLAKEEKQIEGVGSSLRSLYNLIQSSSVLKNALTNPTISCKEQAAVLTEICTALKTPEVFCSFIQLMAKAQRIPYLSQIEKVYQDLVSEEKAELRVEVVSAHPLTKSQVNLLKDKLKKVFPRILEFTLVNDSSVLGGVMVRIGSRVIDATLVTQLNQLSTVMKGNA